MMTVFMFALLVCGVFGDEVKSVSVMEGDSLTLQTEFIGTQRDEILWRFGPDLLVNIDGITPDITNDEGFKDRLQISNIHTGDLIIKNMRKNHAGLYKAEIEGAAGTVKKIFNVIVYDASRVLDAGTGEVKSVSETEGKSVTLYSDVNLQRDALILWRFGYKGALIAKDDTEDNKTPEYPDERFRDRLQVNNQTGDLIIKDLAYTDSGDYKLKISNNKEIIHKTFSLSISGPGLSSGAVAGLCFFFLLIIAAGIAVGVILYRRMKPTVTFVSVVEENPVTLSVADRELQIGDKIEWKFNGLVIITGVKTKDTGVCVINSDDQQFKDRLKLGSQVGHLTINNASRKDTGLYEGKITYNKQTLRFKFNVKVIDRTLLPDELVTTDPLL